MSNEIQTGIEIPKADSVSVETLLKSKKYVKENGGVMYKSAYEYMSPFIDIVSPLSPSFHVKVADSKSVGNADERLETSYGRAMLEASFPLNHEETTTIGIVYCLTSQTPVIKVYWGPKVTACMNLCIFNADHVFSGNIIGSLNSVYLQIKKYIDEQEANNAAYFAKKKAMQESLMNKEQYQFKLGKMLEKSCNPGNGLGTSPIISAVKLINSGKSYGFDSNNEISQWTLYNAVTDTLENDASLEKIPNKTLKAFELVEL